MNHITRRNFIKNTGAATALLAVPGVFPIMKPTAKSIRISNVNSNFEREPLIRPFGFKGGYMTEIWQTASALYSDSGKHSIGLCTQNVLWSDSKVFASHSESGGNSLMFALTELALQMIRNVSFSSPVELQDQILPELLDYGKKITSNQELRKTFVLNSLVGVDNAAWILYAAENGFTTFDQIIPDRYRPALSHKHDKVAAIPLMAYSIPVEEIEAAVKQGYFFMKIKIGQPGTQEEMLEKDKARLTAIHKAIGNYQTPATKSGKLPYYFDANGRYESRDTLMKLLDHAKKIGAFDQIVLIEEPFAEELELDVSDIPVRLAADETAHTDHDAVKRIEMGYRAIALKAIAKTLSMTMKIAQVAYEKNIPCFCADLTVNPVLVEWNKNVAARLNSFPGLEGLGLLESNGHQNYRNWKTMMEYHPRKDGNWVTMKNGYYDCNNDFYKTSGGIFHPMPHYESMFGEMY